LAARLAFTSAAGGMEFAIPSLLTAHRDGGQRPAELHLERGVNFSRLAYICQ
jgi:hypothetical protein